ncbi:early nodulin-like protein 1 [Coffea eugenioides]|uniref:Early nodulin-like protein 9 n=1 Tax=Coffea arabica TaxID=13443 RepID=A0ABM4UDK5_COFAR|nr:early nodulin-like protein 1 [Coffea eugenioides]
MAQANLRSTGKAFRVLGLFSLLLLVEKGIAFEFKVGGPNGWAVPADPNSNSHNQWAEKNRFQTGDSLSFVYPGDKDSVLYVTKEDYNNCSTDRPLQKFTDGHTVFNLNHSGPYYFISGVKDNCLKNEKIIVVVMADRSKVVPAPSNETVAASPPSNETTTSPPPSPSAEVSPSPAPATGESSPPPSGPEETNPTPAPSEQSSPPKSGASSILFGLIGSLGALSGSSLLLFF